MNFEELLRLLDLAEPGEFQYFENFADLIETDEEVSGEAVFKLLSNVDMTVFAEIMESYFDDILENLPEDAIDIYTLINTIKLALVGMAAHLEEERDWVLLSEEICKFRNWYVFDSTVNCVDKKSAVETVQTLRDAVTLSRLEKLGEEDYYYDFDECLEYEIEEYAMSFADIIGAGHEDEEEEHHNHHHHHDGCCGDELEDGFVYDDEFSDDYEEQH